MSDNFYITFSSTDANFDQFYTGVYYLPFEIILPGRYEIALDAFYSSYSFEKEQFISINCDLVPYFLFNNYAVNSCYTLYYKNVNDQIYNNHYYSLQTPVLHSINISITDFKLQYIPFNKTDFCVFKFNFRRKK